MAKYDQTRYYWIKLTDRFMSSDTVDFLMSQKDGANYVVLYQMLCLKTVNNHGLLARQFGEIIIPYDVEKITRDCKWFSADTVRVAMELYGKLGLIYENQEGILAIKDFDRLIGSQTIGAEKKEFQLLNRGGTEVEKNPPIQEKDKDIDKEIDKDKEKDKTEKSSNKSVKVEIEKMISDYANGNEEILGLLKDWLDVRKARHAAQTVGSIKSNLDRLSKCAEESSMSVSDYLREVICKSWNAFYVINEYSKYPASKQSQSDDAFSRAMERIQRGDV